MRLKDLRVGMKVWFSTSRETLRKGDGYQVTVVAMGRYTRTWEPCGALISKTTAPGPTMTVVRLKEPDKRMDWLCRFGTETSAQAFYLVEGGRHLMHDDEHKVHRDAKADRELEVEAWQQRGKALATEITTTVRKALGDLGFPTELLEVHFYSEQRWNAKRKKQERKFRLDVDLKNDKVLELIMSPGLQAQINAHAAWKETPKPGSVC